MQKPVASWWRHNEMDLSRLTDHGRTDAQMSEGDDIHFTAIRSRASKPKK